MYSKKLIWAFLFIFIFLSFALFFENMPAPKNKRVYEAILPYFPYEIKKELGGIDIVNKKTGKDLDIDNAKVYKAYDSFLQKWGHTHLKLQNGTLLIIDDQGKVLKELPLNKKEIAWVKSFFHI